MSDPLRILILEDNPVDAELVQFELQEAGFVFMPKVAMTEEDFVRELQEFSPDLILSDYDLPKYNGALALAEARRRCPDTPFILVTGAVTEDRAIEILTQGAKDYVLKTRLQQRLVPAIRRALAEAEEHRARKEAEKELLRSHKDLEAVISKRTADLEAEIVERKKIEEALLQSEMKYRELVENANSSIIRMDQDGTITFFNTYAQKFFGYALDEILGKNVKILLPQISSNGNNPEEMADNILRSPDDFEENINENVRKNGEHVWLLWKNRAMRDSAGNIIGNLAIGNDITDRKQTEDALRESETRFRTMANSIPQLAWIARADGFIFWYNQRWYDYTGTTPEQMEGWGWQSVHDPKVLPKVMEKWKTAIATGEPFDMEFPLLGADKVFRPFLTRVLPVKNDQGRVIQWFGTNTDLSERKRAEEELALNEREFRLLAESMPQIVWTTRVDGWNTYFNQKWVDYTGLTLEESYGHGWNKPFHPDDQQRAWDAWQNAVLHNAPYLLQCRLRRADGIYRWWLIHGVPVLDENGNIIKWYGTCTDINDLKQAEQRLKEEKDFSAGIIQRIPAIVRGIAPGGTTTFINLAGEVITGYRAEELIGKNWWQVFYPGDEYRQVEKLFHDAEQGELRDYEMTLTTRAGEKRVISWNSLLTRNSSGKIIHNIGFGNDITERKRAEKALVERTRQLEDANKELESFSYSVSHDLKAPLRAIDGYSRMLLKKDSDKLSEDAIRKLDVIRSNADRMNVLIDDLLSFSKVLKSSIVFSEIKMDKLVKEVWAEIQAANAERELELRITSMIPGNGDPTLIRQVLFNLISNAVKFTKTRKPGIIEVSCCRKNGNIVYCIKDNGVGFDMAFYNKLFGVFQRLHSQEEYEGTGVGLAIVHRIIVRHGGRVWAEGEVDKGATFYFTLSGPVIKEISVTS